MQQENATNPDGSKIEIEDKPMVNDTDNNNIKYFLPGPNSDTNKMQVMKSQCSYKESSNMYSMLLDALMLHFHYKWSNQIASHTKHPQDAQHMLYKSHSKKN